MKKLILITSCVALFGAASYAQDTTKTKSTTPQTETQQQSSDELRTKSSSTTQSSTSSSMDQGDMKGWSKVESNSVPANLKTTLSGSQYTGWESGTIYRNEAGDMYQYRSSGNNPKTYYFDKNGKATTKPNH